MSKIHKLSSVCALPEYDLWGLPRTQQCVENFSYTVHRPLAQLNSSSTIEIQFPTGEDEYVSFRDMLLYTKIRLSLQTNDSKDLTADDWKNVRPENNMMQSMIGSLQMEINGKPLIQAADSYGYRAFFETLLGFSKEAKSSFLTAAGYRDKDEQLSELFKPEDDKDIKSGRGKTVEFFGRLHFDFGFQGRALIGNTVVKFTLTPQKTKFFMRVSDPNITPSVEFLEVSLWVPRSKLSQQLVHAHKTALKSASAKYPICRVQVRSITIPENILSTTIDNIVYGQLPRRIFIAFVKNSAHNGNFTLSPFKLEHCLLRHLSCYVDGQQYPLQPFTPDFANGLYAKEYLALYIALNQYGTDSIVSISYEEFKKYPIFAINFAPDRSDGYGLNEHINLIKRGNLSLNLAFGERLSETINVLVYCEFDNLIEIDKDGIVTTDYN